jgi:hypothetical protein
MGNNEVRKWMVELLLDKIQWSRDRIKSEKEEIDFWGAVGEYVDDCKEAIVIHTRHLQMATQALKLVRQTFRLPYSRPYIVKYGKEPVLED